HRLRARLKLSRVRRIQSTATEASQRHLEKNNPLSYPKFHKVLLLNETLSRQISAGYENRRVRSATMLSPVGSEAAPHDTDSSASDLQVTADGAARSQCLPLAGLFRRSTHGRRPFRLPYHRLALPSAAFRCSSFRSGAVYGGQS